MKPLFGLSIVSIALSFPFFQWVSIEPVLHNVTSKILPSKSSKRRMIDMHIIIIIIVIIIVIIIIIIIIITIITIISTPSSTNTGVATLGSKRFWNESIPGLIVLHTQGFVKAIWFCTTTRNQVEWPEQRLDRITKDFREACSDFLSFATWGFRVTGEPVAFTNLPQLTLATSWKTKLISPHSKKNCHKPCCVFGSNMWNQHLIHWPRYSYSHWWNHLVWTQWKRWDVLLPGWRRWNRYPSHRKNAGNCPPSRCH